MKTLTKHLAQTTLLFLITFALMTLHAQTTANWIGPASGGEWNTGANWDTGFPPLDPTTNAFIGPGSNVNYILPMSATSFGILTNNGQLNVNAGGFNCSAVIMTAPSSSVNKQLWMTNSATVVNVSGNLTMGSNSMASLGAGASLTVGGTLTLSASESSAANTTSFFTNNGGTLMANATTVNNNGGTGTGLLSIKGGTNNLGNTAVGRYHTGSVSTLGTEGISISGGFVTTSNLNLGNNNVAASFLTAFISGGTVTNYGSVFINNVTAGRYSRLIQTGGLFVVPDPGVVNPNSTTAGSVTSIYAVTGGGTSIIGGIYFGNSNSPVAATAFFTNAAVVYIGSQGISSNGASINTISLNNGGLFGATADWAGTGTMLLNGGFFTFQAADQTGTPHNITLNGALNGSGGLVKTGGGTLTLNATSGYSGNTLINAGTVVLGPGVSISSPTTIIGPGATFDVSALAGAFSPTATQTISGLGSVNGLVTATAGTINPGSNAVAGTLTFAGGLTEQGNVINHFDLSANPSGPDNDLISVTGDFTVSGANTIQVSGSTSSGSAYPLIEYTGNFNGDVSTFTLAGATGTLSNSATTKTIYFVAQSSIRGPTNIVWVGNSLNNNWDTELTTNWNNAGSLDFFVPGDNARFDNTGGANTNVNVVGSVSPGSITVDSTSNYVFSGVGSIDGAGGLIKTNSDTLTILTTNSYTGSTVINGGVVAVPTVANGGSLSPLGAASSDPSTLVLSGGALQLAGPSASTDRGMTLTNAGGTIDTIPGSSLTLNGTVAGTSGLTVIDGGKLILASAGNSYAGQTTIAGGNLQVNNSAAASTGSINFNNGTLIYFPSGGITVPNAFNFAAATTNTIVVTSGSGANPISGGNWSGDGLIEVSNSFLYTVNGNLDGVTGTILLMTPNASGFRFNSGGGNSSTGSTNATFDLGSGSGLLLCRNAGTMNLGALQGGTSSILQGQDADSGTVVWSIGNNNLSTIFSGTIENGTANRLSSILKIGTGTLTLRGQSTYTGTTTISNGVLALANNPDNGSDGSIGSSTNIYINAGTFLDVSGRSDSTMPLNGGQVLSGNGTIRGNLDNTAGGTVAPGGGITGSLGTLTVTNNINLGGTEWMKINRASVPDSDLLVATNITFGGTLVVTNVGAGLRAGDTFTLFNGALAGGFGNVILPNYYTWDTTQLAVNGTIRVVAFSPPALAADFSTFASGTITLTSTNGVPNGPVSVLTSTNVALPLSSWTTVTSGNYDGTGTFTAPVSVSPSGSNQFFIISAQ